MSCQHPVDHRGEAERYLDEAKDTMRHALDHLVATGDAPEVVLAVARDTMTIALIHALLATTEKDLADVCI